MIHGESLNHRVSRRLADSNRCQRSEHTVSVNPPRPDDFPRGFSETPTAAGFSRIKYELVDGEILDLGIHDYGEFMVSLPYARELLETQTVPFDSGRGRLTVVARFENAIQLKWHPVAPRWRWP